MTDVDAVLVLYHHFPADNAPTILEHVRSFERYSRFPVVALNTDDGFPPALDDAKFAVIVLHYTLFAGQQYFFGPRFLRYLENAGASGKIAFFQDEHRYCPQRFEFIDRYGIDTVYSLLEPPYAEEVYRKQTAVTTVRTTLTGYVGDELLDVAARLTCPDADRKTDIGYRARRLPAFMGRAAQEKHEIGDRFLGRAASSGLRLDIATGEDSRLYGDAWYEFVASCRGMLGVEAGVSVFDLDDSARRRTEALLAAEPALDFDEIERRVLHEYEERIPYRTVSPRHFEAAAFRVVQILYTGHYSGVLVPDVHYLALAKDFSNFDEVMARFADPVVRRTITDRAFDDLVASDRYRYSSFVRDFDAHLDGTGLPVGGVDDEEREAITARLRPKPLRRLVARARFARTRPFPGRRFVASALRRARRSTRVG